MIWLVSKVGDIADKVHQLNEHNYLINWRALSHSILAANEMKLALLVQANERRPESAGPSRAAGVGHGRLWSPEVRAVAGEAPLLERRRGLHLRLPSDSHVRGHARARDVDRGRVGT